MTSDFHDEVTLELALLQRKALDRLRQRNAEQQLGEAWVNLDEAHIEESSRAVA